MSRLEDLTGARRDKVIARQAAQAQKQSKRQAVDRVDEHLAALVADDFPLLLKANGMNLLTTIRSAIAPSARSADLQLALDRAAYAEAKKIELAAGSPQDAQRYNPIADQGWP